MTMDDAVVVTVTDRLIQNHLKENAVKINKIFVQNVFDIEIGCCGLA